MKWVNQAKIKQFVLADISNVEREARFILEILPDGTVIEKQNEFWRLNVISIVGPARVSNMLFTKGVLCEIGIGKTRPYHESKKPKSTLGLNEPKNIPPRKKWFYLTVEQYLAVAPFIFQNLKKLTDSRVDSWKCNTRNPYYVSTTRRYWSQRRKKTYIWDTFQAFPCGTRYAVSRKDEFLLQDIYAAYLNSHRLSHRLANLSRFVSKRLVPYYSKRYHRHFSRQQGFLEIKNTIEQSRLSKYLIAELLGSYLPKRTKNVFYDELCELLEWNQEETSEQKMARNCLPGIEKRNHGIDLKVVHENLEYLVIEVFPSAIIQLSLPEKTDLF
jgi:hypothetical protein